MGPKRNAIIGIVLGATTLALLLSDGAHARTIKVGLVLPYSGVNADQGQEITRGIELYLKLHQKELGKDRVELIKRDSGPPTGAMAKTQVTELITRDKVEMILGFEFSPDAIASAPVVTQAKVPMIVVGAGTAWITNLSPYIVRTSFTMWQSAYPMGTYAAKNLGCKTAAVGFSDYPPGKDSLEAFKTGFEKAGGKIIDTIPMGNPGQVPDFSPFLRRVQDEKPQCLYVFVPGGNHATALVKTFADLGLKQAGIKVIGPLDIVPDSKLQAMGKPAIGLTIMGHYAVSYDNPANQAFLKEWHASYGVDAIPGFLAVGGWDGMAAAIHVIKTVKGPITGDNAMAALKGWTFESPRGLIAIDPRTRDIIQDEHVEQVVREPSGSLGMKVIETIPAVKDPCKELRIGRCGE